MLPAAISRLLPSPGPAVSSTAGAGTSASAPRRRVIPLREVQRHSFRSSLWVIIRGKVYDVTSYVDKHPGGSLLLLQYGGRDATEAAFAGHKGSPLPGKIMKELLLGVVAPDDLKGCEVISAGIPSSRWSDDDACSALASVKMASEASTDECEVTVEGDVALATLADRLYRRLVRDPRLPGIFGDDGITEVAVALRQFLASAFGDREWSEGGSTTTWPPILVTPTLIEALSEELVQVLSEVLATPHVSGRASANPLAVALHTLHMDYKDHARVWAFEELVRKAEEVDTPMQSKPSLIPDMDFLRNVTVEDHPEWENEEEAAVAASENLNVNQFKELNLDVAFVHEVQTGWATFLGNAMSRQAAAETLYNALVAADRETKGLFKGPKEVMAPRILSGFSRVVAALGTPPGLKAEVEALGFRHIALEVTVPRFVLIRDAILGLLGGELGVGLSTMGRRGWRLALNYVGGGLVHTRLKYAERLRIIATSYATANSTDTSAPAETKADSEPMDDVDVEAKERAQNLSNAVPRTFKDMFIFNSSVMGMSKFTWMAEALDAFEPMVSAAGDLLRLREHCDVLALRLARHAGQGVLDMSRFRSVMLASLRSLLPQDWDAAHEAAWVWLWETIEGSVAAPVAEAAGQERALARWIAAVDEGMRMRLRREIYERFFILAPGGQNYFKQSTTRLHFIVDRVVEMTLEMYRQPKQMEQDLSALGLKHVGYGIPTDLFPPFVQACLEVLRIVLGDAAGTFADADAIVCSFGWSLGLVSRILVRTINEGSTVVMKAVNANSARQVRQAVCYAPRGVRADWVLSVQVGTESISPLYNAIERGSLAAAGAMLQDLLTIRADRDRYYYGVDQLFGRHPDVVARLLADAPSLLPLLLDGLVWRSRLTEHGLRRVNYYLKHLVQTSDGDFAPTFRWLAKAGDPVVVVHPVLDLAADTVWGGLVYRTYLLRKSWFIFTLVVYVFGQSVFAGTTPAVRGAARTWTVVLARAITYCFSLSGFISHFFSRLALAVRRREFVRLWRVPVPAFLLEEWQEGVSLGLIVALCCMLTCEPVIRCLSDGGTAMFNDDATPCEDTQPRGLLLGYSLLSAVSMCLYFVMLLDLVALNTTLSAFALSVRQVVPELLLSLFGFVCVVVTWACAVNCMEQSYTKLDGIPASVIMLFRIACGMYDRGALDHMQQTEPWLVLLLVPFVVITTVFLTNVLVGQLIGAFAVAHKNSIGFAQLNRAELIVAWMPSVPERRWGAFLESLRLEERLEFNEGDVGLSGGVQLLEPASAHPAVEETIRRVGGSTDKEAPWPADGGRDEDRMDKLERLLRKALKRLTASTKKKAAAHKTTSKSSDDNSEPLSGPHHSADEFARSFTGDSSPKQLSGDSFSRQFTGASSREQVTNDDEGHGEPEPLALLPTKGMSNFESVFGAVPTP